MDCGSSSGLSLFLLLLFALGFAHQRHFDRDTPASRLDLLHALWGQHSVCIDAVHTNTQDKAVFQGHYYSDKAPGTVVLAVPAFAASAQILKLAKIPLESKSGWLVSSWIACAGSIALITALGAVALFAWLCHFVAPRVALTTVLALFLGAAPMPYSTMMFSHALVVGLLSISLWAADRQGAGAPWPSAAEISRGLGGGCEGAADMCWPWRGTSKAWLLLAGFASGWALASEYSSGLLVVALVAWLWQRHHREVGWFLLGALAPALLVPVYSVLCFEDPFLLPYSLQANFPEMRNGIYGIEWPNLDVAFELLLGPARGLIFWTPFLLMGGLGLRGLAKRHPATLLLACVAPFAHIVVISGRAWHWPAGFVIGPRLLSPILPFLALPCALGVARCPTLGLALASYSIAITTLATLTDGCPAYPRYLDPLVDLHIPLLLRGELSPNLGTALGLSAHGSVAAFYSILIVGFCCVWRRLPAVQTCGTSGRIP